MQDRLKKPTAPGKSNVTPATTPQVMTSPAQTPAWAGGQIVQRDARRGKAEQKKAKAQIEALTTSGIDAAVVIAFPDYLIGTPIGKVGNLGHAGILLIEGKSGTTKYFEYGRYDKANLGLVKRHTIPNVQFGTGGRPTPDSFAKTLQAISTKAGGGTRISAAYMQMPGQYSKMLKYAEKRMGENKNPKRKPYALLSNNCMTFAKEVAEQGGAATPDLFDPRPNSYIDELRDEYPDVDHEPGSKGDSISP